MRRDALCWEERREYETKVEERKEDERRDERRGG